MYMCNGRLVTNADLQCDLKMRLAISLGRLPECMTSLFRELVSVPIALACSSRMTFCPSIANALHIASPTTPAKQVEQLSVQVLTAAQETQPSTSRLRPEACLCCLYSFTSSTCADNNSVKSRRTLRQNIRQVPNSPFRLYVVRPTNHMSHCGNGLNS